MVDNIFLCYKKYYLYITNNICFTLSLRHNLCAAVWENTFQTCCFLYHMATDNCYIWLAFDKSRFYILAYKIYTVGGKLQLINQMFELETFNIKIHNSTTKSSPRIKSGLQHMLKRLLSRVQNFVGPFLKVFI